MVTFRRSPFGGCGIPGHQRHGDVFGLHDRCSTAIHLQLEHAGPNRHSKMALGRQKPTWSMANQWPQLRKVRTDIMILCCHHATQKLHQDLQKWCWFFQCCLVGIIPISSAPIHCWWSHRSIQTPGGQHSRPSTAGSKGSYSAGHRADDSPRDSTRSTNRNQPDRLGNARSSHAKPLSEVHSKTEWFDGLGSCCAARESPRFSYPNETNSCIGNLNLSLYHPKRSAKEMHK